jgi:hypothetical protein
MNDSRPVWRRSSYCSGAASTCVEMASDGQVVAIRDSKVPGGPVFRFTVEEWRAFVRGVRAGEFEV